MRCFTALMLAINVMLALATELAIYVLQRDFFCIVSAVNRANSVAIYLADIGLF